MKNTIDIGSTMLWPGNELSNFARHEFTYDRIPCQSMEGLLQSLKFDNAATQIRICQLVGFEAKKAGGNKLLKDWKIDQRLFWQGYSFDRHGDKYQLFLNEIYLAVSRNVAFREALMATGEAHLSHSIGKDNPRETILTKEEFCGRLLVLRAMLKSHFDSDHKIIIPGKGL